MILRDIALKLIGFISELRIFEPGLFNLQCMALVFDAKKSVGGCDAGNSLIDTVAFDLAYRSQ